jgi:S-formylglutathione hydrolase FrmB
MINSTGIPRYFLLIFFLTSLAYGDIHHAKMYSQALADSNRIIVATPEGFDQTRRSGYPYIIMLHGWSGDETQWEEDSDLQMLANKYQILLVLPDGGYDGWWVNNKFQPGRDYETHIHEELKSWVNQEFNGSKKNQRHGIMGLSMGGFGSFVQALKFPRDYAAAASLSGVLDITIHPDSWNISNALGDYASNTSNWEANNPRHLSQRKPPWGQADLLIICGRDDFAFAENEAVADQMKGLGYPVIFKEEAGAHSHAFWKAHVNTAIAFIVDQMKYPKP